MGKLFRASGGELLECMRVLNEVGFTDHMVRAITASDRLARDLVQWMNENSGPFLKISVFYNSQVVLEKLIPPMPMVTVGNDGDACTMFLYGENVPACKTLFVFQDGKWHLYIDKDMKGYVIKCDRLFTFDELRKFSFENFSHTVLANGTVQMDFSDSLRVGTIEIGDCRISFSFVSPVALSRKLDNR